MNFLARILHPGRLTSDAFVKHSLLTWTEGSVQAGVVRLNNGSAELLGIANSLVNGLKRDGNPDMDRWGYGCEQSLNQAEEMTHSNGGVRVVPDYMAIGLPTDLVQSLSLTVSRNRRGQNEPIGKMEVQALLDRGYREARDTLELQDSHLQIIYGSIGQFTLDGQQIAEPTGLHGSELDSSLCFSLIPLEWLRATQRLAQQLLLKVTLLIPEQVALAASLVDGESWLVVMSRHHTSISLVNRGSLVCSAKIAVGERELTSEVGKYMAMQGRETDVLMRTYREGNLSEDSERRLVRAFWFQLQRWMSALAQEATKALASEQTPPTAIYWVDQTGSIPEACEALRTSVWANMLPFEHAPDIIEMDTTNLPNVLDCTAQANNPSYAALRATALAVARASASNNIWGRHLLQDIRGRRA
ncbi:MAG: hypothetical protein LLG44_07660 [Chloroflexi bacterium]|nr:hypothetical protein [Chloroflexota bacterium]